MLKTAASRSDTLVIGIDANAASMEDASRRAARAPKRGGLPNARFVVAAAESLPLELTGFADSVTVHFPWGSLLRTFLAADPAVLTGIAGVMLPDASLTVLLSVTERDRIEGICAVDLRFFAGLAHAYAAAGLHLSECRSATNDDIAASRSSWAKRLLAGQPRPVWLLRFRRCDSIDA